MCVFVLCTSVGIFHAPSLSLCFIYLTFLLNLSHPQNVYMSNKIINQRERERERKKKRQRLYYRIIIITIIKTVEKVEEERKRNKKKIPTKTFFS